MPFNLFWAPMYLLAQLLAFCCKRIGFKQAARTLHKIPSGFTSSVQYHTQMLVYNQLLGSPSCESKSALLASIRDALEESSKLPDSAKEHEKFRHAITPIICQSLQQYSLTRTASADITNTLISTAAGAISFKQFTPGGLGLGFIFAGIYAKHSASSDFFLGELLGAWYYTLFPPSPSIATTTTSIAIVLSILAVFSAFSGLLSDPIQYYLGLHQKRLTKMLRHLREDFIKQNDSSYYPKDPYVARIMELLDAFKVHL